MGIVLSAGAVKIDNYDPGVAHRVKIDTIAVGGVSSIHVDADVYTTYVHDTALIQIIDDAVSVHRSVYGASHADAVAICTVEQALHRHSRSSPDHEEVASRLGTAAVLKPAEIFEVPSVSVVAAAILHAHCSGVRAYSVPACDAAVRTCLLSGRWIAACIPVTDAIEDGEIVVHARGGTRPHGFLTVVLVGYRGNSAMVVSPALGSFSSQRAPTYIDIRACVRHMIDAVTIDVVPDMLASPLFSGTPGLR